MIINKNEMMGILHSVKIPIILNFEVKLKIRILKVLFDHTKFNHQYL